MKLAAVLIFVLTVLIFCGQFDTETSTTEKGTEQLQEQEQVQEHKILLKEIPQFNDSNSVILKFDSTSNYFYPSSFKNVKSSNLSFAEIAKTDELTYNCLREYDEYINDLTGYRRQYVPVINDKNEKIVWVNYFCSTLQFTEKWKKEPIMMNIDGSTCLFNLTINLTKSEYYDFFNCGFNIPTNKKKHIWKNLVTQPKLKSG